MNHRNTSAHADRLRQIARMAQLKADRSLAGLGAAGAARARLVSALAALSAPEAPLSAASPHLARGCDPITEPGRRPEGQDATASDGGQGGTGPQPSGTPQPTLGGTVPAAAATGTAAQAVRQSERALGDPAGDVVHPLLVRARLAHGLWIERQRAHLLQRLARVEADWHRLRPDAARAFGRAEVLGALAQSAEAEARRDRTARRDSAGD